MMLFDLMLRAVHITTSLVGLIIFFVTCFSVGIAYFSAIQHYRDLIHEFRKTDLKESSSRTTMTSEKIYNDTNTSTEKTSNVFVNRHLSAFNVGKASSSAIQRYRDLHESRKIVQKFQTPQNISIHGSIFNNTDAVTEKTSDIIKSSDVEKQVTKYESMIPSSFLNFTRFASEKAYLSEISSSPTIEDVYNSTTTSTSTTTTSTPISVAFSPTLKTNAPILITTTQIPSPAPVKKKLSTSISGCAATCGSCTEITSESGVIMSPNYPNHYYSPTDIGYIYCHYTINAPEGKRIHLVFQELNLAFTNWGDFLEVVDNSPGNYGKILATFYAGDEAVAATTSGESMSIFFEANSDGFTKNGKAPAWKATYYVA